MSTFNFKNTSFNVNQKTLVNPVDLSGDRIKSGSNKDIITLIKNNVLNINDSSNNFIIRNTTIDFVDIDVSNNIINLNVPININKIVFDNQLLISDSSGNNFMKFDKHSNIINFYKPTDLSGVTSSSIITDSALTFTGQTFNFADNSGNNYLQLDKTSQKIILNNTNPVIQFSTAGLTIQDISSNNFMSFDNLNQIIEMNKPLRVNTIQDSSGNSFSKTILCGSNTTNISFTLIITFTNAFESAPNVVGTISDGTFSFLSISAISATDFTAHTWNASGGIQATFNWQAIL